MNKTGFLADKNKINLSANDLFDRIINVKIVAGRDDEAETEYVIRSDYEVQYDKLDYSNLFSTNHTPNKYTIRRCTNKPSIKIQYKMVTAETGVEIDLFISNFFIFTSDGKQLRNFTSVDYPITRVEIALGYWGQFVQSREKLAEWKIDDLFNINNSNKADTIVIRDTIIVTTESLPPDSTLHIHGYVANIGDNAVGDNNVLTSAQAEESIVATNDVKGERSEIGELLYQEITRRFLAEKIINKNGVVKSLAKNTKVAKNVPFVDKVTGLMSDADALIYGVQVFTSEGVDKLSLKPRETSDGEEKKNEAYFACGDTIGQTMNKIKSCISNSLSYRFTNNGSMFVFLLEETSLYKIDDLAKSLEKKGAFNNSVLTRVFDNNIPAVSNINIDTITTIVCPFFAFIDPFQTVYFATRYALTNNVSYLADYNTSRYAFRTLKVSISFATVEDVNEMQIMAVASMKKIGA